MDTFWLDALSIISTVIHILIYPVLIGIVVSLIAFFQYHKHHKSFLTPKQYGWLFWISSSLLVLLYIVPLVITFKVYNISSNAY